MLDVYPNTNHILEELWGQHLCEEFDLRYKIYFLKLYLFSIKQKSNTNPGKSVWRLFRCWMHVKYISEPLKLQNK